MEKGRNGETERRRISTEGKNAVDLYSDVCLSKKKSREGNEVYLCMHGCL